MPDDRPASEKLKTVIFSPSGLPVRAESQLAFRAYMHLNALEERQVVGGQGMSHLALIFRIVEANDLKGPLGYIRAAQFAKNQFVDGLSL